MPGVISRVYSDLHRKESTFFLAEAATVVFWGMASDKFGRRPVLLLGPLGLSLVMLGFGMTTTFPWLVVFRCLQGAFNGNIGIPYGLIHGFSFDMIITGVAKAVMGEASVVLRYGTMRLTSMLDSGPYQHGRRCFPYTSDVVYGCDNRVCHTYLS